MNEFAKAQRHEEAARWFAALRRGVMTLDERNAYDAWQRSAPNAAAMAEMEQLWNVAAAGRGSVTEANAKINRRRANVTRSALVAAMCVVSLGIGVLSYSGDSRFWTNLDWTDR